jgi:hypothetical protein
MKIKLQLIIEADDGAPAVATEVACLQRADLTPETLGLTLAEAKELLARVQETVVMQQATAYVNQQRACPQCGTNRPCKGHHQIVVRTLFGKLQLPSPRLYTCACQVGERRSFSPLADLLPERTAPELRYLQAKWAALVSYGVTVDLLEEVLPIQADASTVMRQIQQVAERMEATLGDEQWSFIEGCQRDWNRLPIPDGPLTVGIDGGYVHAREGDNRKAGWFEVIVGKSIPADGAAKRFGFVTGYDTKPKRRLFEVLNGQGLQMNQTVTFLSDGGDNVRDLQLYLSPQAEHLLDWFHVTMRITVLQQLSKELIATSKEQQLDRLVTDLDRVKWYVWHGNVFRALQELDDLQDQLDVLEAETPAVAKLAKAMREFGHYIQANQAFIPNYGDRYRHGETISTAFVESTVNQMVSKRMVKKQQMRWTKRGAHLLLQLRARVLDNDLREIFCGWYPEMSDSSTAERVAQARAA